MPTESLSSSRHVLVIGGGQGIGLRRGQTRDDRPDEMADADACLCGPMANAVTGQAISVAGGEVM